MKGKLIRPLANLVPNQQDVREEEWKNLRAGDFVICVNQDLTQNDGKQVVDPKEDRIYYIIGNDEIVPLDWLQLVFNYVKQKLGISQLKKETLKALSLETDNGDIVDLFQNDERVALNDGGRYIVKIEKDSLNNLSKDSGINCSTIQTLTYNKFKKRLGYSTDEEYSFINAIITILRDLGILNELICTLSKYDKLLENINEEYTYTYNSGNMKLSISGKPEDLSCNIFLDIDGYALNGIWNYDANMFYLLDEDNNELTIDLDYNEILYNDMQFEDEDIDIITTFVVDSVIDFTEKLYENNEITLLD